MDPRLVGTLEIDPALPAFSPEMPASDMLYGAAACDCRGTSFRVSGWPRIALAPGGFFWRTVTRVWREAQQPMHEGEPVESPFWLPVFAACTRCGREVALLDAEEVPLRMNEGHRDEPRESLRCRVCRQSQFELVIGEARDSASPARVDFEIVTRCCACHRQGRIAWSKGRPSEQEVRLDLLYGRR